MSVFKMNDEVDRMDRIEELRESMIHGQTGVQSDDRNGTRKLDSRDIIGHIDVVGAKSFLIVLEEDIPKVPEEIVAMLMLPDHETIELAPRAEVLDELRGANVSEIMLRCDADGKAALYLDWDSHAFHNLGEAMLHNDRGMVVPREEHIAREDGELGEPLALTHFSNTYKPEAAMAKIYEIHDKALALEKDRDLRQEEDSPQAAL